MINEEDIQRRIELSKAVDYEAPETIKFPIHVFSEDLKSFIHELNTNLQYNIDYLSIATLYSFAVLNGNCYKLKVKNSWVAPSIFWFIAVGDPGTMKSHPINTIVKPISKIDFDSKKQYDQEMERWESENEKLKPHEKAPRPIFKQVVIKDYTMEALHDVHVNNSRGIGLYRDEIVAFINDMNKYRKGSDQEFWLESFNNNSFIINRVSTGVKMIDNININIIGTVQPDVLNEVIQNASGNGLIDRFLYTISESKIYPMSRNDISQEWLTWWTDNINRFNMNMNYNGHSTILEMNQKAFELFLQYDDMLVNIQNSDEETPAIKNYLSKMKTYLPRFALVLCLMDNYFTNELLVVNERQMNNAWEIINYFVKSARFIFQETDRNSEIKEVSMKMNGSTKKEKIINLHAKGYKQSEISKLLKTPASYVSKIISQN